MEKVLNENFEVEKCMVAHKLKRWFMDMLNHGEWQLEMNHKD
jgi:hypothetical protein